VREERGKKDTAKRGVGSGKGRRSGSLLAAGNPLPQMERRERGGAKRGFPEWWECLKEGGVLVVEKIPEREEGSEDVQDKHFGKKEQKY